MLWIIITKNSLWSYWQYCRSLMLCSDDVIQYLLDECNRTFNDHYGSLVTGNEQIVYCLIIFPIKPMHIQRMFILWIVILIIHSNKFYWLQNIVLRDNHGSQMGAILQSARHYQCYIFPLYPFTIVIDYLKRLSMWVDNNVCVLFSH